MKNEGIAGEGERKEGVKVEEFFIMQTKSSKENYFAKSCPTPKTVIVQITKQTNQNETKDFL